MKQREEINELRDRTLEELRLELRNTRRELFQNRVRFATRNLDSIAPIRAGRKRVARILTLMREKELAAAAAAKTAAE